MKKVLLLLGPAGAGKTTIAELLMERSGFIRLDAEHIDLQFFPDHTQWHPENLHLLQYAHDLILEKALELHNQEKNLVIDYIIFADYAQFINKFKSTFGDSLHIRVLFPSKEELVKRDRERECWTVGEERISAVRSEYEALVPIIGAEHYIDTSLLSASETLEKHFQHFLA